MEPTEQKRGYLGYFIAGGIAASTGGALLAVGLIFIWLGTTFPDLIGQINGVPAPVAGLFITLGIGFAIGGTMPIVVGLVLLAIGMSKKKRNRPTTHPGTTVKQAMPVQPGFDQVPEVTGMERG